VYSAQGGQHKGWQFAVASDAEQAKLQNPSFFCHRHLRRQVLQRLDCRTW